MHFFIKLIIYLGSKNEQRFLRLLAKLEYGVSVFCSKLAKIAREEQQLNLASLLESHAKDELYHGRMLASLADGKDKVKLTTSTGRWTDLVRVSTGDRFEFGLQDSSVTVKELMVDSNVFAGEKLLGHYENFDGLSKRYCSLRILFGGRSAADFDWGSRLAFMSVLESGTKQFYEELKHSKSPALSAIASQICNDEQEHSDYLKYSLFQFSQSPVADLQKWQNRLFWASFGLIVDVVRWI